MARRGSLGFAFAWCVLILLLTLSRVDPIPGASPIGRLCLICGDRGAADAILNVGLFVPLGMGVAVAFGWRVAVAAALLLSGAIELVQLGTPGRFPTLGDVVFNTLGGAVGAGLVGVPGRLRVWLGSPTRAGRVAGRSASSALLLGPLILLAPHAPPTGWWMQWTPDLGYLEAYRGRVLDARVDSIVLPDGPIGGDPRVREALLSTSEVGVTFVAGPPPARVAPVVAVYSADRLQVLMIGVEGDAIVYYRRTLASALALDQPGIRWPGATTAAPGDTVRVRVRRERGRVCITVDARTDCSRSLGARDGWRVLLAGPTARMDPVILALLGLVWVAAAGVPAGLVSRSARSASAWALSIGLAGGVLAELLPETTFRAATVLFVVLGGLVGHMVGRAVAPVRPRVDPGRTGALWSLRRRGTAVDSTFGTASSSLPTTHDPSMERPRLTVAQMLESGGPGGAETVLLQLSDELRARGHSVVPVRMPDGEVWLDDQLKSRGLAPRRFSLDRPVDFPAVGRLAELLSDAGVDVVHSHDFTMAVYGAAAARRLGLPHVITMHGSQTVMDSLKRRIALRWAFRRSRSVVAVSESTRVDMLARLGRRAGPIEVIPNGVPVRPGDASGPRAEFGIAPDDVVILAVGNLSERKGHIVLLKAMARLEQRGIDVPWRVVIAGRGPQREPLAEFSAEAGISDRVHLAGHRDDVPDLQAAAHVLCMPSLWEGLPLAVLEGMHAGNCIVASRTSGIPEAITHGENGLLVEPGEVEPLADALELVLRDAERRRRLSEAALATARDRFSIERMTDGYEALYG